MLWRSPAVSPPGSTKMPSPLLALALFSALLSSVVRGAIYENVTSLPSLKYDYIVVGGGTAGNVLANRLSASGQFSVLVLEAGVSNAGVLGAQIPLFGPSLAPSTPYDWNYTTAPMAGLQGRTIAYPRGFILGGSSSINYMVYNRGSRDDWNALANVTGDPGWSWKAMKPYMFANEKFIPPQTSGEYLPRAHSTSGMVSVSLPTFPTPLDSRVNATIAELPNHFPFRLDMNAGNPIGVGWTQASIGQGQRSSSATAYLGPAYSGRSNLAVLLHAEATKVVQTGVVDGVPHIGAVQFVFGGSTHTAYANSEVILSAGSFNTPKLLMLSGIGDSKVLSSLGINTIVNLPSVGQNMSDHVLLPNTYYVNSNSTFQTYLNASVVNSQIAQWSATHQGPLANGITSSIAWLRLPPKDPIFQRYPDPTPGPTSAHYELIFCDGFTVPGSSPEPGRNYMTVFTNLISPFSRGTVTLSSSNPLDAPVINPNFLANEFDVHTMVAAVAASKLFLSAPAWKDYVVAPWGPLANVTDLASAETFARQNAGSVWHAVGTAAMSPKGAVWGVVDPDLKVKGTSGLRCVDASVITTVPTAHTQGPVYLVAERAAALILANAT